MTYSHDRITARALTLSGLPGHAQEHNTITFLEDRRVHRKVTYRLYPTPVQKEGLWHRLRLHNQLSNAAIEERISAWKLQRKSINFADQCKSLTKIRAEDDEYAALNAQSQQVTLKQLISPSKRFSAGSRPVRHRGFPGSSLSAGSRGGDTKPTKMVLSSGVARMAITARFASRISIGSAAAVGPVRRASPSQARSCARPTAGI